MAPTSEARREVAARLRNHDELRICDRESFELFYMRLNGRVFGDTGITRSDTEIFDRLADLIDPTCDVVPLDEESMRLPHCSICGHPILKPWPNYCPCCGARVLEGNDAS